MTVLVPEAPPSAGGITDDPPPEPLAGTAPAPAPADAVASGTEPPVPGGGPLGLETPVHATMASANSALETALSNSDAPG
jgi:hypothetical protein